MLGPEKKFYLGSATIACLLMLALAAGPLCMGLCPGSSCAERSGSPQKEATCHGMSNGNGIYFATEANGRACGTAEPGIAISVKPDFSVKSGSIFSGENLPAAMDSGVVKPFTIDGGKFLASAGPPSRIHSETSNTTVLRI